jgi:transposase-like protein
MVRMVLDQKRLVSEVAATFGVSSQTVYKWVRRQRTAGPSGLVDRTCRPRRIHRKYPLPTDELKNALFKTLHAPPRDHGFNRTTWRTQSTSRP